jgi:hypothetical protein
MELNELYTVDLHEKGAEMQLTGVDGTLVNCFITLMGIDSPSWAGIVKKHRDQRVKAIGDDVAAINNKASMVAEASIGWRGFTSDGEEIEFSVEKVKDLYLKAPYILTQADNFIAERVNFITG